MLRSPDLPFTEKADHAVCRPTTGLEVTNSFTVGLWIKLDPRITTHALSTLVAFDFEKYALRIKDGKLNGYVCEEGVPSPDCFHCLSGATEVETGVWSHAALTYDGGELRVYLDGSTA